MMKNQKDFTSRLNKQVRIEQLIQEPDGAGGFVHYWQELSNVWAEIKTIRALQRWRFAQVESSATHLITIRYRSDIDNTMRIIYGSQIYTIHTITNPFQQGVFLELLVEERGTEAL